MPFILLQNSDNDAKTRVKKPHSEIISSHKLNSVEYLQLAKFNVFSNGDLQSVNQLHFPYIVF